MPLGYALGPLLARAFGYAWPLTAAAALVIITLAVPVSLPGVRGLRLRHAATAARRPLPGKRMSGNLMSPRDQDGDTELAADVAAEAKECS
jgi:hypothetical protein